MELKDSVFRETPLAVADFNKDRQIAFDSKADAEAWVTERNRELDILSALKGEDSHGTAPLGWDV